MKYLMCRELRVALPRRENASSLQEKILPNFTLISKPHKFQQPLPQLPLVFSNVKRKAKGNENLNRRLPIAMATLELGPNGGS